MKLNIFYKIGLLTLFFGIFSCTNPNDIDPPPPDVGFIPVDNVDVIPFEDLLTLTQHQTFKYFWDFGKHGRRSKMCVSRRRNDRLRYSFCWPGGLADILK